MAFPSCSNPWTANTIRTSDQVAACVENSPQAADKELLDPDFLLLVVDSLQRLGVAGVGGFRQLSDYTQCDGLENAAKAQCAVRDLTPPFQFNKAEIKQIILWQLGNGLCG